MSAPPPPPPPPPPSQSFRLLRPLVILDLDENISYRLHSLFHRFLPASLLLLLELSADFRLSFPLTLAIALSPLSLPLFPLLSPLLLGLLLDLALIGLIKIIFRRNRPHYNPEMSVAVSADHFSFPSGHASRVFFVSSLVYLSSASIRAALIQLRGKWRWIEAAGDEEKAIEVVSAAVWAWAVATASSRVVLGRHFLLDVVAGSCLGVLEGVFAFRYLRFEDYFVKRIRSQIKKS